MSPGLRIRRAQDLPWPNVFIVGAQRAGTTSLWGYLGQHRQIRTAAVKEPNFFSSHPGVAATAVDYRRLFGHGGEAFRIDASTRYLYDRRAAEEIARACPDARVLISLRDPVDRAYSHYRLHVRRGSEKRSFHEAVEEDLSGRGGGRLPGRAYARAGFYAGPVGRYLDVFGDHVHVLFFDDLVREPERAVEGVLHFLGLDPSDPRRIDYTPRNVSAVPRNWIAARALSSLPVIRVARAVVPPRLRAGVERKLRRRVEAPPMDDSARRLLAEAYADDSVQLRAVLDRSLPWHPRRAGGPPPGS